MDHVCLCSQDAGAANLLDLPLGQLGEELGLHHHRLLRQLPLAQDFAQPKLGHVNAWGHGLVFGVLLTGLGTPGYASGMHAARLKDWAQKVPRLTSGKAAPPPPPLTQPPAPHYITSPPPSPPHASAPHLIAHQGPQLVQVDDWAVVLVLCEVEVPHTDLSVAHNTRTAAQAYRP